eukprot:181047_1
MRSEISATAFLALLGFIAYAALGGGSAQDRRALSDVAVLAEDGMYQLAEGLGELPESISYKAEMNDWAGPHTQDDVEPSSEGLDVPSLTDARRLKKVTCRSAKTYAKCKYRWE